MNSQNKKSILLVEDEVIIAMAQKQKLEQRGYEVLHTTRGEDAVQLALESGKHFDIILMDIDLGPGMDGIQTAEAILASNDIPVLFLSSHSEPEIVEKTESVTSYGYVPKNTSVITIDVSIKMALKLFREKMERKRVEDKLANSLAQYESIFESSGTAMVLLDEDGRISAANRECMELTGFSKEEIVGSCWDRYAAPEQLTLMRNYRQQRLNIPDQAPGKYETRLVDKKGHVRDVIMSIGMLPGSKRCVVAMLDITERKRTEEALKFNEESLNLLIDLAPDAFLHGDERGNIIGANLKACEMFGYSREELLTMNIKDLFTPEELEAKPLRYDLLKTGAIIKIERKIIKKNGEIIDIEMNSRKMPDGKHQSFIRDITERKRSEEALRESEERFRALHQASFGGIAIHDQGAIIECNQGMADMSGYTVDELIGMNGLLLIAEKARAEVISKIQAGYEEPYESVGLRKNGSEYPLRIHGRNVHYKGKLVRTTEFRDMTDIKSVEEELRVQLKEKEILLREVHHRIKNNMSSVASLLSLQASSTANAEARELLLESVRRVESVQNVYEKLLHGTDYREVSIKSYVEIGRAHV